MTTRAARIRSALGANVVLALLAAGCSRAAPPPPPPPAPKEVARRAVAVLDLHPGAGSEEGAWLGRAVPELLATELGEGETLRVVAREEVARASADLGLTSGPPAADGLAKLGKTLGADVVVSGEYRLKQGTLQIDLQAREATSAATLATIGESAPSAELLDLATRSGARLRAALGGPAVSAAKGGHAGLPSNTEAARLYTEGVARLRLFDARAARELLEKAVAGDPRSAQAHAALGACWAALGFDGNARQEARLAFEASHDLRREERLFIEARFRETSREWAPAITAYETLTRLFPDNLEYGLRKAAAQTSGGHGKDALATIAALRERSRAATEDPRVDLAEAGATEALSDFARSAAAAAAAARRGEALGARSIVALARQREGWARFRLGQTGPAIVAGEEAKRLFLELGDLTGAARTLGLLGRARSLQGDRAGAMALHREALTNATRVGDKQGMAIGLSDLARLLEEGGELAAARGYYEKSLAIDHEIGDRLGVTIQLNNLGSIARRTGDLAEAKKLITEGLAVARELGDRRREAVRLDSLSGVLRTQGDLPASIEACDKAITIARTVGDKRGHAQALHDRAQLHADAGDLAAARRGNEEALALRLAQDDKGGIADSRLALGDLALAEGKPQQSEPLIRQALESYESQGRVDDAAAAWEALARARRATGAPEAGAAIGKARELAGRSEALELKLTVSATVAAHGDNEAEMRRVLAEATRRGLVPLQLHVRLALCELLARGGQNAPAREQLRELAKEAGQKGFGLVAQRALALAASSGG